MFLGRRNWNNFFLGLVVVLTPWLGLPVNFKNFFLSIIGLLISLFALARLEAMKGVRDQELPLSPGPSLHHTEHEERTSI